MGQSKMCKCRVYCLWNPKRSNNQCKNLFLLKGVVWQNQEHRSSRNFTNGIGPEFSQDLSDVYASYSSSCYLCTKSDQVPCHLYYWIHPKSEDHGTIWLLTNLLLKLLIVYLDYLSLPSQEQSWKVLKENMELEEKILTLLIAIWWS